MLEGLKRLFDTDYFRVDPVRAHQYLYDNDRSNTKFNVDLRIPIGTTSWMEYCGEVMGGVSDRPISSYQEQLFPDVFVQSVPDNNVSNFSIDNFLSEADPLESPIPIFGGYESVFKPGNVVLDIASGEAVADMQLAQKHPDTTIIGVDILYNDERKIYPDRAGLQLTKADWRVLRSVPDNSVDAILSLQGIAMWGLPESASWHVTEEDGHLIIFALNRVSKPGTIIRLDMKNEFLRQNIGSNWEVISRDDLFIARRTE